MKGKSSNKNKKDFLVGFLVGLGIVGLFSFAMVILFLIFFY